MFGFTKGSALALAYRWMNGYMKAAMVSVHFDCLAAMVVIVPSQGLHNGFLLPPILVRFSDPPYLAAPEAAISMTDALHGHERHAGHLPNIGRRLW
jgi:hypothetical protein